MMTSALAEKMQADLGIIRKYIRTDSFKMMMQEGLPNDGGTIDEICALARKNLESGERPVRVPGLTDTH